MRKKRPSAPMVLSIIAVVFSLAGTGAASVATISALRQPGENSQTESLAPSIRPVSKQVSYTRGSSRPYALTDLEARRSGLAPGAHQKVDLVLLAHDQVLERVLKRL
jgi:membrane-bound lytic murein transglycosylase MltF